MARSTAPSGRKALYGARHRRGAGDAVDGDFQWNRRKERDRRRQEIDERQQHEMRASTDALEEQFAIDPDGTARRVRHAG
jgi:hypothetical protein